VTGPRADVAVLGAGAWGGALALAVQRTGRKVLLWGRGTPGPIAAPVSVTSDLDAARRAPVLVLAVPAQAVRAVAQALGPSTGAAIVIAAKGLEQTSGLLLSDVLATETPKATLFVLSGPSFAEDVVAARPVAVALAGPSVEAARDMAQMFASPSFRVYPSDDVRGVQAGGALKNVLAIACGIADGRELGGSARAALITRSFGELSRLVVAMGGRAETVFGLSGLGDLVLTATGGLSRNYGLGLLLGQGYSLTEATARIGGVSEGRYTAAAAAQLAQRHGIATPIIDAVDAVIAGRSSPQAEIERLLARPMREER
jgi:glycerol-3-phosphate dehydrogenase (NAD(P)+)